VAELPVNRRLRQLYENILDEPSSKYQSGDAECNRDHEQRASPSMAKRITKRQPEHAQW
jgi:hypothetical protein